MEGQSEHFLILPHHHIKVPLRLLQFVGDADLEGQQQVLLLFEFRLQCLEELAVFSQEPLEVGGVQELSRVQIPSEDFKQEKPSEGETELSKLVEHLLRHHEEHPFSVIYLHVELVPQQPLVAHHRAFDEICEVAPLLLIRSNQLFLSHLGYFAQSELHLA